LRWSSKVLADHRIASTAIRSKPPFVTSSFETKLELGHRVPGMHAWLEKEFRRQSAIEGRTTQQGS
jgi:hypothetical protein